jgi:hypothetical protein
MLEESNRPKGLPGILGLNKKIWQTKIWNNT